MNLQTEPVRLMALVAGILVAVSTALLALDAGQSVYFALGQALAYLGLVVGGGELARTQAWAPATVGREVEVRDRMLDEVLSAEDALGRVTVGDVPSFDAPDEDPDDLA